MSIYVSPSLDQDQRIYRTVSFYDLVELMTYGRLSFDQSARIRLASLRSYAKNKEVTFDMATADITTSRSETAVETTAPSTTVVYQSWALLEHEQSIDWSCGDESEPSIHIVSTINALAESLFVGDDMEAFIGRTSRNVDTAVASPCPSPAVPAHSSGVQTYSPGAPPPAKGMLAVTLWPRKRPANQEQHLTPRIPIDLRTLLKSVLISPKAPTRFVELVSHLVQRISHARVSRANLLLTSAAAHGR